MSAATAPHEPIVCRAELNYLDPRSADGNATVPTEVPIFDGRRTRLPGWETCGFQLVDHRSAVRDWDDGDAIAAVHYAEVEALARQLTGCDHALVSGHIRRNPEEASRHLDLAPITFVHSDFAASYGALVRRSYGNPGEEVREALDRAGITASQVDAARRLLILQFWRNTGPARMDLPIAFCDARTVPAGDLKVIQVYDYAGGGTDFETLGVLAPDDPERHRWYAFPEMARNEVVAFRTYDTERIASGAAFWTPHSAFRDPSVPLGSPSRRSIELRASCLFL